MFLEVLHLIGSFFILALDCINLSRCMILTLHSNFFTLGSDGILSEARWLLDIGLQPNSNSATRAIGYRQVCPWSSAFDISFHKFVNCLCLFTLFPYIWNRVIIKISMFKHMKCIASLTCY